MNFLEKFFAIQSQLEALGLMTSKDFPKYFCTPLGAVIFARLGVDGIHYCIIKRDGDNNYENSPVYVISPMMPGNYVELVGRNFLDFLSLVAACRSASALECVSYMSQSRFNEYLYEDHKSSLESPDFSKKIDNALLCLKSSFHLQNIHDVYGHIQETRKTPIYNMKLRFSQEYYDINPI